MSGPWDSFKTMLWRQRERWKAWRNREKPLREFVYLDETSVYSLSASRFGEIKSERTDTLARVRQSEVRGSLNPAASAAGAGLTARAMSSQSQQSQVVSRAIVQTTFKDLLEKERNSLSLRHVPHFEKTPRMRNQDELRVGGRTGRRLKRLREKGFVVDPDALRRGALLEVEVELESEFIFRFSSVVQEFAGMFEKNPALFEQDEEGISEFSGISDIVERLLVGLIPLRGRAVDYSVVVFDASKDEKLVVHNRLLEGLGDKTGFTTRPLFVVGVTEQALFWKDIRRVLFAGQRFRVLCRVARDDISGSWVPLKLQEVVSSVFPDIGREIEKVSRRDMFEAELNGAGDGDADRQDVVRDALRLHASRLAELGGVGLSDDDTDSIDSFALERRGAFESMTEQRAAFKEVEDYMADRHGLEIDADAAGVSRRRAREVTTTPLNTVNPARESATEAPGGFETPEEYFLDSEFVAIYW